MEVKIDDIKEKYKNATYVVYKAHNGWVRQGIALISISILDFFIQSFFFKSTMG